MNISIDISVAVCTYNRADIIEEALQSLINQDFPSSNYEIIIVDNNSTDCTPAIVQKIITKNNQKNIKYLLEKNQGLSFARNRAISEAQAEYIAFIDDDGIADPHWLSNMIEVFEHNSADAIGGSIDLEFRSPVPYWLNNKFQGWLSIFIPTNSKPYQVFTKPWPVGCNMAFRRSVLLELNGFNPEIGRKGSLLLAGEETAVFESMRSNNKKIWIVPAASVKHIIRRERLTKRYFLKLQKGLMLSRRSYYQRLSRQKQLSMLILTVVEIIANGIGLILGLISVRYWFLAYIYLYRSLWKFTVLLNSVVTQI